MNPSADIAKDARGMDWDLTHLHSLQDVARMMQWGSFFVPYFVSFDVRWSQLLCLNLISLLLTDDKAGGHAVGRSLDQDFHAMLQQELSAEARLAMTAEKIASRRKAARNPDRGAMRSLVDREKQSWG